jgi:hypothetical protein
MEFFLSDILDLPPGVKAPTEVLADGTLHLDYLVDSAALRSNLAFREAWFSLFAVFPSRLDYWDFLSRAGPNAIVDCIIECSPVRGFPMARDMLQQAVNVYGKTSAALGNDKKRVMSMLRAKLADRFGVAAPGALGMDGASLLDDYMAMVMHPESLSMLACFETWAADPSGKPPSSVVDYYARSARAISELKLLTTDPISNYVVSVGGLAAGACALTCIEAMRATVLRDSCVWRADAGGALLVLNPPTGDEATRTCNWVPDGFRFRTVRAPLAVVLKTVPPGMYARMLVPREEGPTPTHGATEIIRFSNLHMSDASTEGRRITIGGGLLPTALPAPPHYWVPDPSWFVKAAGSAPAWAEHLLDVTLSAHMTLRCPLSLPAGSPAPAEGILLFYDFVARYVAARRLQGRTFACVAEPDAETLGEVIVIDSRKSVMSALAVLVTLDNLRAERWTVTVICSQSNVHFMRAMIAPHVKNARFLVLDQLDGNFTVERYSAFMKEETTWSLFRTERVLIVQDDGMLVRRGLDAPGSLFMDYDYVGAPWAAEPYNAQLRSDLGPGCPMVGNGGVSLRRVETMARMCREHRSVKDRLFNFRLQVVPEDVFFVAAMAKSSVTACPESLAHRFATEEVIGTSETLGFHKPWPYLPVAGVAAWFNAALDEAAARAD